LFIIHRTIIISYHKDSNLQYKILIERGHVRTGKNIRTILRNFAYGVFLFQKFHHAGQLTRTHRSTAIYIFKKMFHIKIGFTFFKKGRYLHNWEIYNLFIFKF
jgi:hypothetical protein